MATVGSGIPRLVLVTLVAAGCGAPEDAPSGASTPLAPASVTQRPPVVPPPSGSSFKNCRGGRNLHWWVAHIENVTADDLQALAALNLKHADRSDFDPTDLPTLAAWLKTSTGSDAIFHTVSAQLAIATLNVRHGFAPDAGTFVMRDQANQELGLLNPSIGWLETLQFEFSRCQ